MPPINVLIKPASGNCNLRCEYCFYFDTMSKRNHPTYGYMSEDILENTIKKVLEYAERECTIAYQGGEPTLAGLDFFKKSIQLQEHYNTKGVKIYNALQTNGYNINEEWADFFVKNKFLVGVSLDGGPRFHDLYRKTASGNGSFEEVMKTVNLFKKKNVEFNILTVVNGKTAPSIKKLYAFFKKYKLNYLQFIACLDPLGEENGNREYSLEPEVYGKFLIELFDMWYEDLLKGEQPYIRQFENYISILLGKEPESCDMRGECGRQYVVEADGSVYPCDFYVLDDYKLGNLNVNSIEELDVKRKELKFIEKSHVYPHECRVCKYFAVCRNGCRRTRDELTSKQYFCKANKIFFDACFERMFGIADKLKRYYR